MAYSVTHLTCRLKDCRFKKMVFSMDMDDDDDQEVTPSPKKRKLATMKTPGPKSTARARQQPAPKPSPSKPTITSEDVLQLLHSWIRRGKVPLCPEARCHTGLTVGSACSGWCSELIALQRMGRSVTCCFACDCDPHAKAICTRTHNHCRWYDDVTSDAFLSAPYVDLFFSGFPCQPFSLAGKGEGLEESRGLVVLFVLRYIAQAKPKTFALENVEGLVRLHKPVLLMILEVLSALLDDAGKPLSLALFYLVF